MSSLEALQELTRDARALAKRQGFSESPTFFRQEGRLAVLSYQRWEQVA